MSGLPEVVSRDCSRSAGEGFETRDRRDGGGVKSAAGDHNSIETVGAVIVVDEPSGAVTLQQLDPVAEPDAWGQAECRGIAMEVVEDVAVGRVDQVTVVLEVAIGRHDATCVGVHGRPRAATALQGRPLPAQHRSLLVDRHLETLRQQPPRGDEPARSGSDHGDGSGHRGTVARPIFSEASNCGFCRLVRRLVGRSSCTTSGTTSGFGVRSDDPRPPLGRTSRNLLPSGQPCGPP